MNHRIHPKNFMSHIVIIGNGIAGISAARHIRKNGNFKITVISGETDYFFSRTALMYIYMGHMKYEHTKPYEDHFWKKNQIDLVRDWISSIDFDNKILLGENGSYSYDKLIIASGSKPNKFGWKGQDLQGVQGLYSYQDLELMELNTQDCKQAVVVGGGLIGIEMAEMLHARGIHVLYLVRENHFWDMVLPTAEAAMIERHIRAQGIDLRLATELEEIIDDGQGKVSAIKTKSGEALTADFVGLTVGVSPNITWLRDTPLEMEQGILINDQLQTNLPDVYAIGDCAQLRSPKENRRAIEAVWYTGRMMGETVAHNVYGNSFEYDPGIWFNSAKFFNIEYQTYGTVNTQESSEEKHFYWEAEDGKHCVRIAFQVTDMTVLGINTFGIRMRHEIWDQWLREKVSLSYAIENLRLANFDPEFFRAFEPQIQQTYNVMLPEKQVRVSRPSFFQRLLNT